MNLEPRAIGLGELALRVVARSGAWFGALVSEPETPRIAEQLAEEIALMGDVAARHVDASAGASELALRFHETSTGVLVAHGFDHFSAEAWRHLDLLRSQLVRDEPFVMVLSTPAFERLMRSAPNLASLLGGAVWQVDIAAEFLTDEERERRLQALRAQDGLSDADMIARVERGELLLEPRHAEWLVLLGRGDLLGRV